MDAEIAARTKELAEGYKDELWELRQKFQAAAKPEEFVVVDIEWGRSLRLQPLTKTNVLEFPLELKEVQERFLKDFNEVPVKVAQKQIAALQLQAQNFAKQGQAKPAQEILNQIAWIRQNFLQLPAPIPNAPIAPPAQPKQQHPMLGDWEVTEEKPNGDRFVMRFLDDGDFKTAAVRPHLNGIAKRGKWVVLSIARCFTLETAPKQGNPPWWNDITLIDPGKFKMTNKGGQTFVGKKLP